MTPQGPSFNLADLGPRIGSGLVMIFAALFTDFLGGHWFAALWLLAACAVFWEWLGLVGIGSRLVLVLGIVALAAIAAFSFAGRLDLSLLVLVIAAAGTAALSPAGLRIWAAAGLVYAASLVISTIHLRQSFPLGWLAILWLFAVVWGTDIFAYFGGRIIGGPKLWPRVSPSKTWSGFLVGITAGAIAGLIIAGNIGSPLFVFILGLIAGAMAQAGDLLESSIKRRFGAKDSSHLIPGHGGVMDRLDGFIAASLFAFLIGTLRSGMFAPANGLFYW